MIKLTKEQAEKKAIEKVYVYMVREDIENECKKYGIELSKDRDDMERKLIDKYIEEWTK